MTFCHALFCFLFLSVQVKNSSPVDEINHFYRLLGEELEIICYNLSPGPWKIFCRETCEGEDVLVNMTDKKAASGRNSAEFFERQGFFNLSVKISNLTQSDSGRYRCGLVNSVSKLVKFKAIVVEALLDGNKDHHFSKEAGSSLTVACSFGSSGRTGMFCKGGFDQSTTTTTTSRSFSSSFTHATTRQSFSSSSAGFTPSGSSETTKHPALGLEEKSSSDVLLLVGLTLAFILIVLAVALLVFCRKRSERQRKDPFVKSENTPATTTEVRNNENTSAAVQISTIYSYASYCTTAGAEGNDIYSLVTAVPPQNNAEDDLSKPTYAQLSFPNRSSDSPPGPSGRTDVVYSLPVVAGGGRAGEESLYSNTT
ncbi:uncharacterized protein V3H82_010855 isoform 5-T5 [Fundulus diaphanus]